MQMPSISTTMNPHMWAMLILLSVLWDGSFFFVKLAAHDLPVLTIVFLRVSLRR